MVRIGRMETSGNSTPDERGGGEKMGKGWGWSIG